MIVPSHSERPYPSHLKKQYQSFLQSKYNFLGGPYGKGPQENLQRKFCADIYQKILIQIERKKKTPDQYFSKYDMNKGLKTITTNNFSRALKNLDLILSPYETELLVNSLETEKHLILSLKNSKGFFWG